MSFEHTIPAALRTVSRSLPALAVLPLLWACNSPKSSDAAAAERPASAVTPAAPPPAAATASAETQPNAQSSYREPAFSLVINGPSTAKAGETVELAVVLEAGAGYKVNEEYPFKFKFAATDGVQPEQETVPRSAAQVDHKKAVMPIKLKLTTGRRLVAGRFSFAVCKEGDDAVCLIEKRDLSLPLDAS
jgi:hypothetical protein